MDAMKGFLIIYWFIGCAISGSAMGFHLMKCPHDDTTMVEMAAAALAWPTIFFAMIYVPPLQATCRNL